MLNFKKLGFIIALSALITSCTQNGTAVPVSNIDSNSTTIYSSTTTSPAVNTVANQASGAVSNAVNSEFSSSSIDPKFSLGNTVDVDPNSVATNNQLTANNQLAANNTVKSNQRTDSSSTLNCTPANPQYTVKIPRDAKGRPIYSKIEKGSYTGEYYEVQKGDSLYLIGYLVGKTDKEIARLNNISDKDEIKAGRRLLVNPRTCNPVVSKVEEVKQNVTSKVETVKKELPKAEEVKPTVKLPPVEEVKPTAVDTSTATTSTSLSQKSQAVNVNGTARNTDFIWPANGKIISSYKAGQGQSKGIRIAGDIGDKIQASQTGSVLYAGDKLQGYGNVVLIRSASNPKIITLYAHLSKIMVRNGQSIDQGQVIGLMGNTGTSATHLYFEIRKNGKDVDPLSYLPRK